MGDVDQFHHAEDQRKAGGEEGIEAAEENSLKDRVYPIHQEKAPKEGKGSRSFLKKRTQKRLLIGVPRTVRREHETAVHQWIKVFWFFFSKKNCLLACSLG
jgi:hypothetical protein